MDGYLVIVSFGMDDYPVSLHAEVEDAEHEARCWNELDTGHMADAEEAVRRVSPICRILYGESSVGRSSPDGFSGAKVVRFLEGRPVRYESIWTS